MTNFELIDALRAAKVEITRAQVKLTSGEAADVMLMHSWFYLNKQLDELQKPLLEQDDPEPEACESCGQPIEDHGPRCDTDPRPVRTVINGAVLR